MHYPYFSEGWALYAENPLLPQGTDIYDENQVQKYGMLKWQIWCALRLVIDIGLHYKGKLPMISLRQKVTREENRTLIYCFNLSETFVQTETKE